MYNFTFRLGIVATMNVTKFNAFFSPLPYIIGNFDMDVLFIKFYEFFISVNRYDSGAAPLISPRRVEYRRIIY